VALVFEIRSRKLNRDGEEQILGTMFVKASLLKRTTFLVEKEFASLD
jgi:hypothetical protein